MQPVISVILPTYNGKKHILEAIESVLSQTFDNFELLVIDDGATDGTYELVNTICDDRIIYIKKDINSGIADSLNLGISKAKGKFIARMDDDDICFKDRFEKQLKIFEQNPEVIVCGSGMQTLGYNAVHLPTQFHEDIRLKMLFNNSMYHPTIMMRTRFLKDEMYNANKVPSEDYELWSRLIWKGKFYNIQEPLIHYRLSTESQTSSRRKEQLNMNIATCTEMFIKSGFIFNGEDTEFMSILVSHDYSISGTKLRRVIFWLNKLGKINVFFKTDDFNILIKKEMWRFVKSYFMGLKKYQKTIPFVSMPISYKWLLLKFYFKKLI